MPTGTDHDNLIEPTAIHPGSFVASSDPGAQGANKFWTDTGGATRVLWIRNAANSAWVSVGNPMTASGDVVYGGTAGNPTRLAATTNGYVLTLVSGLPAWQALPAAVGSTLFIAQSCV